MHGPTASHRAQETAGGTARHLSAAGHILLAIFLARLVFLPLFCSLTDLAGDESYYWEWGRRPDWCYFSKPPLIGWLMGLVGLATNHAEWGIRLAALLCGTASLWFLQALANAMSGARAARLTLWLAALSPANAALNLFFTIDAPLVLCWSAALLALWRVIEQPGKAARWCLLALAMSVGVLAKQMMLVFPLLILLLCAFTPDLRPMLRRAGLWLSIAVALVSLAPVLWWNQQHHWVTFEHTSHHFDSRQMGGAADWLGRFLSFPALQSALFTPLTWGLMITVVFRSLWRWRTLDVSARMLVMFSAPALIVFFLLALRQSINPNWPAVYYLSAIVLLGVQLSGASSSPSWMPRLVNPTLALAAAMTLLSYAAPCLVRVTGLEWHEKWDVFARLRGWSEIGARAGDLLAKSPRPAQTFFLVLGHREHASQLSFYTPQHPPVYRWQLDGSITSQYELWPPFTERTGWDALIFQPSGKPLIRTLTRQFESVEKLTTLREPPSGPEGRVYEVYLAKSLQPQTQAPAPE